MLYQILHNAGWQAPAPIIPTTLEVLVFEVLAMTHTLANWITLIAPSDDCQ